MELSNQDCRAQQKFSIENLNEREVEKPRKRKVEKPRELFREVEDYTLISVCRN